MLRVPLLGNHTGQRSIPRHCQVDDDLLSKEAISTGHRGLGITAVIAVLDSQRQLSCLRVSAQRLYYDCYQIHVKLPQWSSGMIPALGLF
jgi:hypothetical protein